VRVPTAPISSSLRSSLLNFTDMSSSESSSIWSTIVTLSLGVGQRDWGKIVKNKSIISSLGGTRFRPESYHSRPKAFVCRSRKSQTADFAHFRDTSISERIRKFNGRSDVRVTFGHRATTKLVNLTAPIQQRSTMATGSRYLYSLRCYDFLNIQPNTCT
jgi:hypothetical protein